MKAEVLVIRLVFVGIGVFFIGRKLWQYQRGIRDGTVVRNPDFARAGKFALIAVALFAIGFVLVPMRISMGWPRWLFYPFFATFLAGMGYGYYAAWIFARAKMEHREEVALRNRGPVT